MTDTNALPPNDEAGAPLASGGRFALALLLGWLVPALIATLMMAPGGYLARFGQVAAMGAALCAPIWFSLYAWLTWRAARRGGASINTLVLLALGANFASALFWALAVYFLILFDPQSALVVPIEDPNAPSPSALALGAMTGALVFFYGLFFMPIQAAIMGWAGGKLKAWR